MRIFTAVKKYKYIVYKHDFVISKLTKTENLLYVAPTLTEKNDNPCTNFLGVPHLNSFAPVTKIIWFYCPRTAK